MRRFHAKLRHCRVLRYLAAFPILIAGLILAVPRAAFAIPSAPAQTFSFYVTTSDTQSDFFTVGANFGEGVANGTFPNPSSVVLDFGAAYNNGTDYGMCLPGDSCSAAFISTAAANADVEQFGAGFYSKANSDDVLYVAYGINNSGSWFATGSNSYDHGETIGNTVNNANTWMTQNGYASEVHVRAATDAEPSWNTAGYTGQWSNGYDNTGTVYYWDFGSADGCPTSGTGGCNNSWSQYDVWNEAWGYTEAEPIPQIYDDTLALQWGNIDHNEGAMTFLGPMDQHQACADNGNPPSCSGLDNTSDQAWDDLYNALHSVDPQTPPDVTNIRWTFSVTV